MTSFRTPTLALALAVAAASPTLAQAAACKVKFTFTNQFDSLIQLHSVATLYGPVENIRNKKLRTGERWTSSTRRLRGSSPGLTIEPGDPMRMAVNFKVWNASQRNWTKFTQQAPRDRNCRNNANYHMNISPDRANPRNF